MAGRFFNAIKSILRREKSEEGMVLRELEEARKLINWVHENASGGRGKRGGWWIFRFGKYTPFGVRTDKEQRKFMEDAERKLQLAYELVSDAKKHDKRILAVGTLLVENRNLLPPAIQDKIKLSEKTELFISELISPRLTLIAQNVIRLKAASLKAASSEYGWPAYFDMVNNPPPYSTRSIDKDLGEIIERIKELFSVHAQTIATLKSMKAM